PRHRNRHPGPPRHRHPRPRLRPRPHRRLVPRPHHRPRPHHPHLRHRTRTPHRRLTPGTPYDDAGITADTRKPPASVGPDTNTPPSADTRSFIPTRPLPPDGNPADDTAPDGGSFSTCIAISDTRCATRTYVFAPAACLCTFVNASCTTRNAVDSTCGAYDRLCPTTDRSTTIPAAADCPTSSSISDRHGPCPSADSSSTSAARDAAAAAAAPTATNGTASGSPARPDRNTPSISRNSVSACRPMSPTSAAFFTAFSGSFRATACNAAACTTIRLTR